MLDGLDVVIRLYDTTELPCLDHCIFSLLGQARQAEPGHVGFGGVLRLHVMLQRFSFTEVQTVRKALGRLMLLDEAADLTLHNWDYPEPFDLRVPLLNWGFEVARSRYATCVSSSDRLFPGTYARLLVRLQVTQAVIALGGMAAQPVCWWGDVIMPVSDESKLAIAPLGELVPPVFLVDRARLGSRETVFRAHNQGAEINEFISRLRLHHEADIECEADLLAVRQVFQFG